MSDKKYELLDEDKESLHSGHIIPAIRSLRSRYGLDLKTARNVVDDYRWQNNLMADWGKDERKVAVYDQLVEALKEIKREGNALISQSIEFEALKAAGIKYEH